MKRKFLTLKVLTSIFLLCGALSCEFRRANEKFVDFVVDPSATRVQFFWRDAENGEIFRSFENVKKHVEKSGGRLRFAMNGGMFQEDRKPLGLFIENDKIITPLNTRDASGNFYLKPNGVFGVRRDGTAFLVTTENFADDGQIKFATQSGPMLLVGGAINRQFTEKSDNLNIRNGVCVLENGTIFFSMARLPVNLYDFAAHFRDAGCRDALYLDGFVSKMYLPEKSIEDSRSDFGVIIAIVE